MKATIKKAKIILQNSDSETSFDFSCDEDQWGELLVRIVSRGSLMASFADSVTAYKEDGSIICSYTKEVSVCL